VTDGQQTDRRTDRQNYDSQDCTSIAASHGKNPDWTSTNLCLVIVDCYVHLFQCVIMWSKKFERLWHRCHWCCRWTDLCPQAFKSSKIQSLVWLLASQIQHTRCMCSLQYKKLKFKCRSFE